MLFYSATLDVPISTVRTISAWLKAHRKKTDRRLWQPAATCWKQTAASGRRKAIREIMRLTKRSKDTVWRWMPLCKQMPEFNLGQVCAAICS